MIVFYAAEKFRLVKQILQYFAAAQNLSIDGMENPFAVALQMWSLVDTT
ncbi:MAG: hypothetical protein LBB26_03285 [Puniceicoccales bacterium]|jgi:hypothetical protein|nr:hypothetical protein [Puniceicoccales bacterium]